MRKILSWLFVVAFVYAAYRFYKYMKNKKETPQQQQIEVDEETIKLLDPSTCEPDEDEEIAFATEYKFNEDGQCVAKECESGYFLTSEKQCVLSDVDIDFKNQVKSSLLNNAENKIFVSKNQIEKTDPDIFAIQYLNSNCKNSVNECSMGYILECENDPTSEDPTTNLDCDFIVEPFGVACQTDMDCKSQLFPTCVQTADEQKSFCK